MQKISTYEQRVRFDLIFQSGRWELRPGTARTGKHRPVVSRPEENIQVGVSFEIECNFEMIAKVGFL